MGKINDLLWGAGGEGVVLACCLRGLDHGGLECARSHSRSLLAGSVRYFPRGGQEELSRASPQSHPIVQKDLRLTQEAFEPNSRHWYPLGVRSWGSTVLSPDAMTEPGDDGRQSQKLPQCPSY